MHTKKKEKKVCVCGGGGGGGGGINTDVQKKKKKNCGGGRRWWAEGVPALHSFIACAVATMTHITTNMLPFFNQISAPDYRLAALQCLQPP